MSVVFCPVASGSNGNSVYIGSKETRVLIDAGLSGIRIEKGLESLASPACKLDAIFITHEHSDHIQGAGILSRRHNIPLYATEKTWQRIERHNMIGKIKPENKKTVCHGQACRIKDIELVPFSIPHDAADPVGYKIFAEDYKISVATDIGEPTDEIKESIADSHVILLESNHDMEMLQRGRYPQKLKDRVMGKRGHLSNVNAGLMLAEIMSSRTKYVYLGHLSEENNRPLIAMDTVRTILLEKKIRVGCDVMLMLAERGYVSQAVRL